MELIYLWIEEFRNIKKCGFRFSSKYDVEHDDGKFYITPTLDKIENTIYPDYINNITVLVGKNGTGKSNILKLLGDYRPPIEKQYFIAIYWIQDDIFCIEGACKPKDGNNNIIKNIDDESIDKSKIRHPFRHFAKYSFSDNHFNIINGQKWEQANAISFHFFSTSKLYGDPRSCIQLPTEYNNSRFTRNYHNYGRCEYIKAYDFLKNHTSDDLHYNKDIKLVISLVTSDEMALTIKYRFLAAECDFVTSRNENNPNNMPICKNHSAKTTTIIRFYEELINLYIKNNPSMENDLPNDDDIKKYSGRKKSPLDVSNGPDFSQNTKQTNRMIIMPMQKYPPDQFKEDYSDYLKMLLKKIYFLKQESPNGTYNNRYIPHEVKSFEDSVIFYFLQKIEYLSDEYFVADTMRNGSIEIKAASSLSKEVNDLLGYIDEIMLKEIDFTNDHPFRLFQFQWHPLSGGEQQYLQLNCSLYHAVMKIGLLNSETQEPTAILLLDEPDNLMHPETTRRFIANIINLLRAFQEAYRFQIIIATHSPLILSDVTRDSVILLEKDIETGQCLVKKSTTKTFASNIHTLLAKDFFMQSTIGLFAEEYIQSILNEIKELSCNTEKFKNKYHSLHQKISIIGEDVIRYQLEQKLTSTLLTCHQARHTKIELLEQELQKLRSQND